MFIILVLMCSSILLYKGNCSYLKRLVRSQLFSYRSKMLLIHEGKRVLQGIKTTIPNKKFKSWLIVQIEITTGESNFLRNSWLSMKKNKLIQQVFFRLIMKKPKTSKTIQYTRIRSFAFQVKTKRLSYILLKEIT